MDNSHGIEITPGATPTEFYETPKWWLDLQKAYDLLCHDAPSEPVDILYFFGRSYFDAPKEGLYRIAVNLYRTGMVKKIIIPGTEGERLGGNIPREAHPGKILMQKRLVGMGISPEDIVFSQPGYHTRQEGDAFLTYSKEHGLCRAIAITNPHQIVRAMLGLLKTINDHNLPIKVYGVVHSTYTYDWGQLVKGSQGRERKPVFKHLYQELLGISTYQRKSPPDLATFDELFKYMELRDKAQIT